jgi:hypothetical protein
MPDEPWSLPQNIARTARFINGPSVMSPLPDAPRETSRAQLRYGSLGSNRSAVARDLVR